MIPEFPKFIKIDHVDKKQLYTFTSQFAPYHDFSYVNLVCWDVDNSTELSMLDEVLVVKLPDNLSSEPRLAILGSRNLGRSLDKLLKNNHSVYIAPQVVIDNLKNLTDYTIEENRDNYDYIYNLHSLADLEGRKYKIKRQQSNKFKNTVPGKLSVKTEVLNEKLAPLIKKVYSEWEKQTADPAINEHAAFQKLVNNAGRFELLVTLLYIDSSCVGFSINEIVQNDYAICHFEKAISSYDGVYAYLIKAASEELLIRGLKFTNWEPDLGLEGLRHSKLSYHPDQLLKKYSISRA